MKKNTPTSRLASLALLPAALGLSAALVACDHGTGAAGDSLQARLLGQWFPCEDGDGIPGGNADCKWVDDDGIRIEAGRAYATDGAIPEDPAERDTSRVKEGYFDITIKKLVGYKDDSAAYTLKGDTLHLEWRECPSCPVEIHKDVASIEGEILTIKVQKEDYRPRRFRRYAGTLRVVTFEEYLRLTRGLPE
jgi:hypothetical protein